MRPHQVLLFIIAVMVCLGTLCFVLPERVTIGDKTLRWPTMAEVLGVETSAISSQLSEETENPVDTVIPEYRDTGIPEISKNPETPVDTVLPEAPKPQPVAQDVPKVNVDSTTDSRVYLAAFYSALGEAGTHKVRVLHYGDSQIEEDRMTQQIREKLQAHYGGSGAGLLPLAQTIPSRTVRQRLKMNGRTITPQQGPRRYIVYGPKRDQRKDGKYGVMGQVAMMNDSLVKGSEALTAICTPLDGRLRYEIMRVFADSSIACEQSGDTVRLNGRGAVYGLSQESSTGVIVDNIPMRGCLGLVFTKMDSAQLATFYREENVRLIIMQFGGNAIPFNETPSTIRSIVHGLREQVRTIKAYAPEASILFIGPSDMLQQTDGEWQTYPMIPYMDRLLRKMALEEHIAYFSLYQWMGGSGSMKRWQEVGLAGNDGIHFYRSGARKAGNAVAEWILSGTY
ncbi:MAG: hypothetical protein IJS82_03060 [Paludibacteraceae bacterium]|nr:hypothetical protein [Paludibacteraceae bacterium]